VSASTRGFSKTCTSLLVGPGVDAWVLLVLESGDFDQSLTGIGASNRSRNRGFCFSPLVSTESESFFATIPYLSCSLSALENTATILAKLAVAYLYLSSPGWSRCC